MNDSKWRGSFAIPMTPYDDRDRIDEDILAEEIEFCIQAGSQGIVAPVMVSEFGALSEDERRLHVKIAVDTSAGRVPVVANCAGVNAPLAVRYAEFAQNAGADAVIAMPPYVLTADFPLIYSYFTAISQVVTVPIWIQNAGIAPLSTDQIVRLCSEIEHVSWVKEEVNPSPNAIGRLVARKCPQVRGVMGGAGGRFMITEWARGSKGVVHACQFCDIIQRIWNMLEAAQTAQAGDLFERVLPALVLEGLMGMAFAKEIMVRRGIFKNHRVRTHSRPLDPDDLREIDRVWERIQPYLVWSKN
jgi:dihydrodipicolinate synthase/N-acetylneuraminate lyase